MDGRKENITGFVKAHAVGIWHFIHYRDLYVFHIGSVLQGRDSTRLKKMIVQAFSRGIFNTCARCSVYKGQPHCGMKQDVDTESLLKMGLILAIFQSLLATLTCRKEAATPNYTEKNPSVP